MFKLRTKPPQFTKGKTEDTLCDLTQRYLLNVNEDEYHLLDIVVTNKSIAETEQWKIRTDKTFKNFENITIDILSSKSDDYNNISTYILNILNCKTKNELPNILIICYHEKRVCNDLIKLFDVFGGENFIQTNSKIKFHISFDEPDANLGVTKKFIKKVKKFIDIKLIVGILFITATPIEEFWKVLNDNGITTLLNMNYNNTQNFDEEMQNYRSFKEHNIIEHDNDTNNPLYYIMDIFSKNRITLYNKNTKQEEILHLTPEQEQNIDMANYDIINKTKIIDQNERKIIFSPAHLHTETEGVGSHKEIVSFFNDKNYCVFLMNGKFKGFIYPNEKKIELSAFNLANNIKGELRESLVKWNELHPTMNLAITGYWVIERGITFNTIGFNFTDMILSNYHSSSMGKLEQLGGRSGGGKKFVQKMNVICTKKVKEMLISFNDNLEKICSINPENFNRTDFLNSNSTIPVKTIFNDIEVLNSVLEIRNKSTRGYKNKLHEILLESIQNNKITIIDRNNSKKFDITKRSINQVRMYKLGDKIDVRRFKNFNDAFENYKNVSQTCDETQYNIDLAKDNYIQGNFINESNIAWITYKF